MRKTGDFMAAKVSVGFNVDTQKYFFSVSRDGEEFSKRYTSGEDFQPDVFAHNMEGFLKMYADDLIDMKERHDFVIDTMFDIAEYLLICLTIPDGEEIPTMVSVTVF